MDTTLNVFQAIFVPPSPNGSGSSAGSASHFKSAAVASLSFSCCLPKVKEAGLTPITTPSGSKAFSEAWMIIECRKMVSQSLIPEALHDSQAKEKWGTQLHKMYIGEILNVWVK